jgi:hypothetical protein
MKDKDLLMFGGIAAALLLLSKSAVSGIGSFESDMASNYYKRQLSQLDLTITESGYRPQIKLVSGSTETKWMGLNTESINALQSWLKANKRKLRS